MAIVYLKSRAIRWVDYDAASGRLLVRFKSGHRVHGYRDVPRSVYAAFLAAPSPRAFHDLHLKDRYEPDHAPQPA